MIMIYDLGCDVFACQGPGRRLALPGPAAVCGAQC